MASTKSRKSPFSTTFLKNDQSSTHPYKSCKFLDIFTTDDMPRDALASVLRFWTTLSRSRVCPCSQTTCNIGPPKDSLQSLAQNSNRPHLRLFCLSFRINHKPEKHRFFFSSHIRFFLACEENKARKKKCEKEQSEEKLKRSEEASILSDFRIVRVKNPASKYQNCE